MSLLLRSSGPRALALVASTALLASAPAAGTEYDVTITGTVDFNGISSGVFGSMVPGEPVSLAFRVDSDDFVNSGAFPTRGYFILEDSWTLSIPGTTVPLEDPYSGAGAKFVIRDNDPGVDGFLVSDNVNFPVGVPLDEPGIFGPFEHAFQVTYPQTFLPSLDIADAVGTYDFTGLSVFNWTIDDGPFNPAGFLFAELTIEEVAPFASSETELSLSTGGIQPFDLNAGAVRAGWIWWIFGSVTGTSPAFLIRSAGVGK